MLHLLETVEDLDRRGIGFRSLGDPVDTTTPQGRFTLQILAAVGELERALIRERTVAGLEHARKEGRVGGNPGLAAGDPATRSEEHTSEIQSLMRISSAVFCLKKKNSTNVINKSTKQTRSVRQH